MSEQTVKKPRKSKVPKDETPETRFIRLAKSRGDRLVHQMKLLQNLGKGYAYQIDSDLAEDLLVAFKDALEELQIEWEEAIVESQKTEDEAAAVAAVD